MNNIVKEWDLKMRNYLRNVPDVFTMKEADEIFCGSKDDKELENALEKYSWKSFGSGSGWVHVCSRYLTAKKDQYPNIEHRLYLNTESLDTYKMTTYLVEKCDEHHLPYYFKFDQYADRDDTIVIYSSTDNLPKYLEILNFEPSVINVRSCIKHLLPTSLPIMMLLISGLI